MTEARTAVAPLSIFDLFGDRKAISYDELVRIGYGFDQPKITVDLLIQHALKNGFVESYRDESGWGYKLRQDLPY